MIELPAWTAAELTWMRVALGAIVLTWPIPTASRGSSPRGLLRFVPFAHVVRNERARLPRTVATVCFIADVASPLPAIVLATLLILTLTLHISDGAVNHGHHLTTIAVTAYAAAEFADWIDRVAELDWPVDDQSPAAWTVMAVVAAYFMSGASKVFNSGGRWLARATNLQLSIHANALQRVAPSTPAEHVAALGSRFPRAFRIGVGGGLFVEAMAPLGLLHPTALFAIGILLVMLHIANGFVLDLPFTSYQAVVVSHLVVFSLHLG